MRNDSYIKLLADKGILLYRGYDVNELADKSSYLETAFLLVYGELPSANQLKFFSDRVMSHTYLHTNLETFMQVSNPLHSMLILTLSHPLSL